MRKIRLLCTIMMLTVGVLGCGSDKKDAGSKPEPSSKKEQVSEKETEDLGKDQSIAEPEETEKTFETGTVNGDVYENEFTGMGYKLNAGWTFYSDDQIRELNNATGDMMEEEYQKLLENSTVIYEMFAVDSEGINNFNVNVEKLNKMQMNNFDISSNFEQSFPIIESSYENMGYTDVAYEVGTAVVAGRELDVMYITAEISGIPMYQTMFSYRCGQYLVSACASTFYEDTSAEIFENIYWLD